MLMNETTVGTTAKSSESRLGLPGRYSNGNDDDDPFNQAVVTNKQVGKTHFKKSNYLINKRI